MKYLKLIVDQPIHNGHATYLFFGRFGVDVPKLEEALKQIKPFTLTYVGDDAYGHPRPVPVRVYQASTELAQEVRAGLLDNVLGSDISALNRKLWSPHISLPKVTGPIPDVLNVIGVESNDGSFRVMF